VSSATRYVSQETYSSGAEKVRRTIVAVTHAGEVFINRSYLERLSKGYGRVQKEFEKILKSFNVTGTQYLASETAHSSSRRVSRKRS
jgi:hypothetical protein